jgi:hypothetical protein
MLIPAIFYGHYPEVQKRCRKAANRIAKGEPLENVLTADGMLDTVTTPGFITFEPVDRYNDETPGFHTFPLCQILIDLYFDKKIPDEIQEEIYQTLLQFPWGVLMLIGRDNSQAWLASPELKPERLRSFTQAAIQIQDEFTTIGQRFEPRNYTGRSFWGIAHGLIFAMANLGFSKEEINQYREQQKIPESILESPLLKP